MALQSEPLSQSPSKTLPSGLGSPKKLSLKPPLRNNAKEGRPFLLDSTTAISTSVLLSGFQEASTLVDSSVFLTALATQERRVLELNEELHKAEEDLEKLKKQWATHEITKKRSEIHHTEQLRPLRAGSNMDLHEETGPITRCTDYNGHRARKSRSQQTQRKVFSGSRQTRALSLLSSDPFNEKIQTQSHIRAASLATDEAVAKPLSRSATTPAPVPTFNLAYHASSKNLPKDAILETGKQLVGDLRGGLWTFFEDLRQATVGEEAASGIVKARSAKHPRSKEIMKQSISVTAKRKARPERSRPTEDGRSSVRRDINDGVKETHIDKSSKITVKDVKRRASDQPNEPATRAEMPQHEDVHDDGGWDNWDSPKSKHLSPGHSVDSTLCTPERTESPSTGRASSRTSTRYETLNDIHGIF